MTQDEIIEMAKEAVADRHEKEFGVWWSWEEIESFAKLVAAKEREACAVIAETPISGEQDDITMEAKDRVAKTIRARGEA